MDGTICTRRVTRELEFDQTGRLWERKESYWLDEQGIRHIKRERRLIQVEEEE